MNMVVCFPRMLRSYHVAYPMVAFGFCPIPLTQMLPLHLRRREKEKQTHGWGPATIKQEDKNKKGDKFFQALFRMQAMNRQQEPCVSVFPRSTYTGFWTIAAWNSPGWVFGQNGPKQPHLDQLGAIHAQ
jgi:hypothetical protein